MSDQSVDKEFVQCANGHYYNPRIKSVCPFCGAIAAPVEMPLASPPISVPEIPPRREPIAPPQPEPVKVEPVKPVEPPVVPPVVNRVEQEIPKPSKCREGHWYDAQRNRECPYCKENASSKGKGFIGRVLAVLFLLGLGLAAIAGLWLFEPELAKMISNYRTDSARSEMPVISAFDATPDQIQNGGGTTLRWSVLNSTKVVIDHGVGEQTGQQTEVHPTTTTLYKLTATGPSGQVQTSEALVTVNSTPLPAPTVEVFKADPATFDKGQEVVLHWTVQNATTVHIDNGVGEVTGDQTTVRPDDTTTYKLTASNATSSAEASIQVTLNSQSPQNTTSTQPPPSSLPASIDTFTATPSTIEKNQGTVLRWTARNFTSLSIDHNVGAVTGDNIVVHPDTTTTYTLSASGAKPDSRTVTVVVNAPPPPPVSSPESGSLSCKGVTIQPHGEVYFNLPAGKLRFYNLEPPGAWKLHIKTLPDGKQQLFMASQLNTVLSYCALNWESLFFLQISAYSRQMDADVLSSALRVKGYKVSSFVGTDKLIHVVVGDASTKKDGDALRTRLLNDGYNAAFVPAPATYP